MHRFLAILLVTALLGPVAVLADDPPSPYGRLFRALAGDRLEREHGIAVIGFAHVSAAVANHHIPPSPMPQGLARNTQPQSGVAQDEGLNLNHVGILVCKGAGCPPGRPFAPDPRRNVLSRITPLPGPRGEHVVVDWGISALLGEDAVYWQTKGLDDWHWNADDAHRLALTQWYLDIYLPVGAGASLLLGSWHTPMAAEIGYAFVPPNYFASRTYAFAAGPAKHVGGLLQAKLPLAAHFGHASIGFGIASDWNSLDFGSGAGGPSFIMNLRWRSPDMATWVDIETTYGNGEDDFGDARLKDGVPRPRGGGSQYLVLSSSDEYLDRFIAYLTVSHALSDALDLVVEGIYMTQEGGDLAPTPFAVTRDSALYGLNAGFRYRLADRLHAGARLEWFADENAANVLWSGVGARGGKVTALTLNLSWLISPHLLVRPELKYDSYDGGGHLFAPDRSGIAQHDSQLLATVNFEFRF
ncbi:MAG: outer membrane beta-barrel protein [Gammaproteobacteria bacterium]